MLNNWLKITVLALLLSACSSYKQNILFKSDQLPAPNQQQLEVNSNRIIEIGDYLTLEVFTKNGEKIIDPDFELANTNINAERLRPELKYLVRNDGYVKAPMVGEVELEGKTLHEAEEILQKEYERFYKSSFVNINFLNKRVIVLGSAGGQVVPLENENTTLVEIIALSGGIDKGGKGHNIRILRDNEAFLVDLTTIEGYQSGNILMEPGDVVYIEPVRRPFSEFIRENGPVISIFTSLVSLVAVLISVN
ncbi:polysaccharide biosynthesis/export family protein [Fulvivirga lutimaris]|uniref:polysaccharide biosynthesis/export family protein n=1 Tax=Fulvivirga lutimaris TaxID=1819566 RepID=UPI001623A253|nr:polysaccharide biosynthesis/export family protein [Fulvivirga lutimaris]